MESNPLILSLERENENYERTKNEINSLGKKIASNLKIAPSKPRETIEQIDAKIANLEFKRSTTTLSLKDEKQILQEISTIRKSKSDIKKYLDFNIELDKLRSAQDSLRANVRVQLARINELKDAIHLVNLGKKLNIEPSEVFSETLTIPERDIGTIVGKNGTSIKLTEAAFNVSIDVGKGVLKISGRANNVLKTKLEIEEILAGEEVSVSVSPPLVKALFAQKGAHRIKLENDCRVKIFIDRDNNIVKMRGSKTCIANAKRALNEILNSNISIVLDPKIVSTVIGKGGETIKSIQEECSVEINIDRSGDQPILRIYGEEAYVIRAKATLEIFIEENTEYEDIYSHVDADAARGLIGSKGCIIKRLEAESGAEINVNLPDDERKDSSDRKGSVDSSSSSKNVLVVRGTRDAVAKARNLIDSLLLAQSKENVKIDLSPDALIYLRHILPKLQKDRSVSIEIVKGLGFARVRGKEEAVTKAVELIEPLKTQLKSKTIEVLTSILGSIFGKGGSTINRIISESKCSIEIEKKETQEFSTIALVGMDDEVKSASKLIQAIVDANHRKVVILGSANLAGGFCGKGGANIKAFQSNYSGIQIDVENISHTVTIVGPKDEVEKACKAVIEWKVQYSKENAELELTNDQIALLSFEVIKNIIAETSANIQVLARSNTVKVFGTEESVNKALTIVKDKAGFDGDVAKVLFDFPSEYFGTFLGKGGANIIKLQSDYGCNIKTVKETNKIELFGKKALVDVASEHLSKHIKEMVVLKDVNFPADKVAMFVGSGGQNIKDIQASTQTQINIAKPANKNNYNNNNTNAVKTESVTTVKTSVMVNGKSGKNTKEALLLPTQIEPKEVSVRVKGTIVAVEAATLALGDIANGLTMYVIKINMNHIKALESDGGSLANVAHKYNCKIRIEKGAGTLSVIGIEADVIKAKLAVFSTLKFLIPNQFSIYPIQKNMIKVLNDKKYQTKFDEVEKTTDAKCDIDILNSSILISGSVDAVSSANSKIQVILDKYSKENAEILIPSKLVSQIIGKGGVNIKKLREDSSAEIDIDERSLGLVYVLISGTADAVTRGKGLINAILINEKENHVEIEITQSEAAAIIGKGGATVKKLQEASNARITCDKESGFVSIHGRDKISTEKGKLVIEEFLTEYRANVVASSTPPSVQKKEIKTENSEMISNSTTAPIIAVAPPLPVVFSYDSHPVGYSMEENDSSIMNKNKKKRDRKKINSSNSKSVQPATENGTKQVLDLILGLNPPPSVIAPPPGFPTPSFGLNSENKEIKDNEDSSAPYYKSSSGYTLRL